jgi:hypothetical protein
MLDAEELHRYIRLSGVIRGGDLLSRLQASRPTLSRATMMRQLRSLGDAVISRGAARRAAYAARRPIRGNAQPLSIYRIGQDGRGALLGTLSPTYPAGCALDYVGTVPWPLDQDMLDGWYPGIPYFLDDMRPQGFLGRAFALANSTLLQVPADPTRWSEDDTLHALSLFGDDTSGDLIIGDVAYQRHLERLRDGHDVIREADYLSHADAALAHGRAGSSAGGEFPKFTAFGPGRRHVLVKFSGKDATPGSIRWADLLVCEHIAAETINACFDFPAAENRIIQAGGRTFLESVRFDRHGEFGRAPMCSWAALEAAFFGMAGASWTAAAARLREAAMIDGGTATHIAVLWHFGKLIGNTDMHEGNLSFMPGSSPGQLVLTPIYDMLPMAYAPLRGVELPAVPYVPALPLPQDRESWRLACTAALAFWRNASRDMRISEDFRRQCSANAEELSRVAALV